MLSSSRYFQSYNNLKKNYSKKRINILNTYNILSKNKITNLNSPLLYLYIPSHWSLIKISSDNSSSTIFYLFTQNYYVTVTFNKIHDLISYDSNYRVIYGTSRFNLQHYSLVSTLLKLTFKFFNLPSFVKIKFKGKGYYVYKGSRNTVTPQFNYYHRIYIYSFFSELKFIRKTSIIIFGYLIKDLIKVGTLIKSKRPINVFTGRGVRFARQIIYKKTGKVSSYR